MEFLDHIKKLGKKVVAQKELLQTEEATKNALVMPFIVALGYDVFDPEEVVPEYVADVGMKKGEKVDYVLIANGEPQMIIECKKANCVLQPEDKAQLHRYFGVLADVRFGILTNGIVYRFYSDIDNNNIMDDDPFLEIDLSQIQESLAFARAVESLERFSKARFSPEKAIGTATNLKYLTQIKKVLENQYKAPSAEFVRVCMQSLYSGPKTQTVIRQFTEIVRQAFNELVNDEVNRRLKLVFEAEKGPDEKPDEKPGEAEKGPDEKPDEKSGEAEKGPDEKPDEKPDQPNRIVTTEEEIAAVDLIKDLISEKVNPERVFMRDQISYCGVLLDNNNRKVICRLFLSQEKKHISLFSKDENGEGRKETKQPLENIQDITAHKEALWAACAMYEGP